ncbi:hypothetical protein BJ165DRAFT_1503045 [Panaeolus papilionaceus]|nr:hypothetical protein BJ165DRAFT_1503045 [Panaeolus papilionaceus]
MSQAASSSDCAEARDAYDACFKHWFKGYFNLTADPAYPYSSSRGVERCQKKADEYKDQCGDAWKAFRNCVEVRSIVDIVLSSIF